MSRPLVATAIPTSAGDYSCRAACAHLGALEPLGDVARSELEQPATRGESKRGEVAAL